VQNVTDLVVAPLRKQGDMYMLGHYYVIPNVEIMLAPSAIEGINKPLAGSVLAEEFIPLIARKRQFVGVIG